MRSSRLLLLPLLLLAGSACSRKVVVTTPSARAAAAALKVTNTASQAVTVVVSHAGTDYTVGTVGANSTAVLPVAQVPAGATVTLHAQLADGSKAYTRDGVVLDGTYEWRVP